MYSCMDCLVKNTTELLLITYENVWKSESYLIHNLNGGKIK